MPQTIEDWQRLYGLAEAAMIKDTKEISRLKQKVNQLEQSGQWISVDRPPTEEGAYWCYDPTQGIEQSVYFYSEFIGGFNNGDVTHWTNLLPRPKGK